MAKEDYLFKFNIESSETTKVPEGSATILTLSDVRLKVFNDYRAVVEIDKLLGDYEKQRMFFYSSLKRGEITGIAIECADAENDDVFLLTIGDTITITFKEPHLEAVQALVDKIEKWNDSK